MMTVNISVTYNNFYILSTLQPKSKTTCINCATFSYLRNLWKESNHNVEIT